MKWDIPQFKALIDGLLQVEKEDIDKEGANLFSILADAFDEQEDERGKFLRRYLKYQCYVNDHQGHHYRRIERFDNAWRFVRTITHLHPFEFSLRNTYAYWSFRNFFFDQGWKLPGCKWDYQLSTLRQAMIHLWSQNKCDLVLKKLARNGIFELRGTSISRPLIRIKPLIRVADKILRVVTENVYQKELEKVAS